MNQPQINEVQETIKDISKDESEWVKLRKENHRDIRENLDFYRQRMWIHCEDQKKYRQSVWEIATCGYCFKDKFQKSWMYVGKLNEIVCKSCLFRNKLWK